jgi:Flp pilus assembly protein TadG
MSPGLKELAQRFRRNRSGGTAMEFALVAPVFLFCAFALIQVGYGIYAQSTVSQLAEQGARHLLFASDDTNGAKNAIIEAMRGTALDPANLTVLTARKTQPYPHVELTLHYAFSPPGVPLPQDITLSSVALIPFTQ